MNHLGIDYGSNLAGTTAICYYSNDNLTVICSNKNKSADKFIKSFVDEHVVSSIFMDAPLSLPKAYYQLGHDYFYRDCDRTLKAMSPMFLGGLTARAIKLKNELSHITFYETYPKQLVRLQSKTLQKFYKKDLKEFGKLLRSKIPYSINSDFKTWHHMDSILAWWSGYRHFHKNANRYGNEDEGLIIV